MTRIFKYIKPIFIIALLIYLFDQGSGWIQGRPVERFPEELQKFAMYLMYSAVLGVANIWVVEKLEQRFSWEIEPKKRAVYGVIGAVLITMLSILLLRLITVLGIHQQSWDYFISHERVGVYIYSFLITMFIVMVFYVIHFYKAITKQAIFEHQTIAKTEIAKYETLKSQIDPHFLFNSLNVLTSLIEENPKQAEKFTAKLSRVYRYVLEQKEKTLVPLQEEVDFAKVYMELLRMRFEEAIQFEIPVKFSSLEFKIAPLSLQILLENAVKHNAISVEKPLKIRIIEKNKQLVVSNSLNKKNIVKTGTGIGLYNILDRYALLTKKKIEILKTENNFIVKLPLLTQITKIMKTKDNTEENRYYRAKERVDKMKGFYANLISYIGINTFLVFLNYYTGWSHKWFVYPLIGWGIGLLFHYFEAFERYPFLNKNWEEKKIKELMEEDKKETWE